MHGAKYMGEQHRGGQHRGEQHKVGCACLQDSNALGESRLMSYKVILEESIMQKGIPATAGSKMLENFISPIGATVVTRLESAGAQIVGRADMDEFGVSGLFGTEMLTEAVSAVANGKADFALCNDYTGATGRAAAAQGVCYIHPTYGTVSRYGLIPAVISMDQIGIICKTPAEGFKALKIIAGYDPKDGTMPSAETTVNEKSAKGFEFAEYESKYSGIFTQIMQILCCAEFGNNISRYDGIKYGYRAEEYRGLQELYTKSRTEAFGADVKLAAMIGAMVLSQENYTRYYDKAMRLRRLIRDELRQRDRSSGLIKLYSEKEPACLALSRLCGLPAVATPGCTYIADAGREDILEAFTAQSTATAP